MQLRNFRHHALHTNRQIAIFGNILTLTFYLTRLKSPTMPLPVDIGLPHRWTQKYGFRDEYTPIRVESDGANICVVLRTHSCVFEVFSREQKISI